MRFKFLFLVFLSSISNNLYSQGKIFHTNTVTDKFDFKINIWVNMHHLLYHEANLRTKEQSSILSEKFHQRLSVKEKRILDSAIGFYQDEILSKHQFFSDYMINALNYLSESEEDLKTAKNKHIRDLKQVLTKFKPIYEENLWEQHFKQNKRALDENLALVKLIEKSTSERLSSLFKSEWQNERIKVDLSVFGGLIQRSSKNVPYTLLQPTHIVMTSSINLIEEKGLWLELLFHEASHHLVLYNKGFVANTIDNVSKEMNVSSPRGLWHAYLFYISGVVSKEELFENSYAVDETYMKKYGVFSSIYPSLKKLDNFLSGEKTLRLVTREILKELNDLNKK